MGDLVNALSGFRRVAIKMRELPSDNEENVIVTFSKYLEERTAIGPNSNFVESIERLFSNDPTLEDTITYWVEGTLPHIENEYAQASKETKRDLLHGCLGIIAGKDPLTAREMIRAINDPYLAADILINLDRENREEAEGMGEETLKRGIYWQNIGLMNSYCPDDEEKEALYQNPQLLSDMQGAVAASIINSLQEIAHESEELIIRYFSRYLDTYDKNLHDGIIQKVAERNWVRLGTDNDIRMGQLAVMVEKLYKKDEVERL
jgi:hypothetical protein